MIVLDTNVVTEARRAHADERVVAKVAGLSENAFVSVVVLGEIRFGIDSLKLGPKRARLEAFYKATLDQYAQRLLPVTVAIAESWGAMRAWRREAGRPLAQADGLIAATAYVHNLTLWTRDAKDFEGLGIDLFNPWED